MTSLILIVDDDPVQRRLLEAMIRRFGYEVEAVDSGEQALARLRQAGAPPVSLLLLDLVMPDLDGMGVLTRLRDAKIVTPAIVQTAHGSIETVISAMRAGAQDFVVKPVGAERLQISIKNALAASALAEEMRCISRRSQGALSFRDLVSRSESMARVVRLGERAATSTIPVLIEGESGVGKELIARAIQGASDRRGKPFVTVNCGALPANLVESILLAMRKAPSPARLRSMSANSPRPMAARCFSMKSANCRSIFRSSFCARCRRAKSIRSARAVRSASMCG